MPTVVGYANATRDLHEGDEVIVDGDTGLVTVETDEHRGGEPMKTIAWLAGIGTLVAGAVYMIVSLNRWEWNRALFFGLIVLIAEVGLATALILRKLGQLDRRPGADPATLATLRSTRPPSPDRFEWLKDSAQGTRASTSSSPSSSPVVSCCRASPGWSTSWARGRPPRSARSAWRRSWA